MSGDLLLHSIQAIALGTILYNVSARYHVEFALQNIARARIVSQQTHDPTQVEASLSLFGMAGASLLLR
jgi:hypothetical protein